MSINIQELCVLSVKKMVYILKLILWHLDYVIVSLLWFTHSQRMYCRSWLLIYRCEECTTFLYRGHVNFEFDTQTSLLKGMPKEGIITYRERQLFRGSIVAIVDSADLAPGVTPMCVWWHIRVTVHCPLKTFRKWHGSHLYALTPFT